MTLVVNGQEMVVPQTITTVHDLLEHYDLEKKRPIVELNQTIIDQTEHLEKLLANGDRLEIVHFVGGG